MSLEFTYSRVLSIWWAFIWRSVVFSGLAGLLLGIVAGVAAVIVGDKSMGRMLGAVLGWLASIPVSFFVLAVILKKQYREFTIQLVPRASAIEGESR